MKKIFGLLSIIIYLSQISCKPESFVDVPGGNVSLSFNYDAGRMQVPNANNYTKNSEIVTIPLQISLSGAAPKIFQVELEKDEDTVKSIINSNNLLNTVALETNEYTLPSSVNIPYGATTFQIDLVLSTATIEKYYGKDIAVAVKLASPTRGNTLDIQKKAAIIIIKTTEVIGLNEIRNISFTNSGVVAIPTGTNFTIEPNDILIPMDVELAGDVSEQFIITQVVANPDTINKLVADNTLSAGTLNFMDRTDSYVIPTSIQINAKKSKATINLRISRTAIAQNFNSPIALAFTLSNPTKFKVQASKSTVVLLLHPTKIFEANGLFDISALLKNTKRPFIASSKEPAGRWGVIADWITNDAVNNHVVNGVRYGSFDNNNSTNIAMESGWGGAPNITDGKIYQTVTLPAGKYRYETSLRSGTSQNAYAVAVNGTTVPNTAQVSSGTTLANAKLPSGTINLNFTLTAPSNTVTFGYVATLTGNQSVNIQSVKLLNVR